MFPQQRLVRQVSIWLRGPHRLPQGCLQREGNFSRSERGELGRAAVEAGPAANPGSFLSRGGLTWNQRPLPQLFPMRTSQIKS